MIKPAALTRGDRVAVIAPSSCVRGDREAALADAEKSLSALGLVPEFLPSCRSMYGSLSGTDAVRAADVNEAFSNPLYKGIICLRGGYGSPRILDRIDYEAAKANPKVFLGYSDITGLHLALNRLAGLVTFHGPMGVSEFNSYTCRSLERCLFETGPLGKLVNPPGVPLEILSPGQAAGRLTGGNLSLIAATLGSDYEIDCRGALLYLEDVDEEPYRLDRMLNALRLAGKFRECAGIILGTWASCEAKDPAYTLTWKEIFSDQVISSGKPVLSGLQFGHVPVQMTIPSGVTAVLNGSCGSLSVIENHSHRVEG